MPNRHARRPAVRATGEGGRRTGSGFTRVARERPLLVVGLGIALGMALGALLPWDRMDDEFFGGQATKLKDGALDLASESYERVKSVAQTSYDTAAEMAGVSTDGSGLGESSPAGPRMNETYQTSGS
jgi:hypothetical protein